MVGAFLLFLLAQQPANPAGTPPQVVEAPKPNLAECHLTRGQTYTAVTKLTVDPQGAPQNVSLAESSGNTCVDDKAVAVVHTYRFRPATRDGQPVPVTLHIQVNAKDF